jgi:hypothetical protein
VARGEATLLRCEDLQPVSLTWQNGLLATSERLLVANGGEMVNRASGEISINLQHVTVNARSGLCLISNAEGSRPLLHTEVQCTDSILLAAAEAALVEQTGVSSVDEFQNKLEWIGNRYFYSGFDTFWKISSFASAQPTQNPIERSFDDWQQHWNEPIEDQEVWRQVVWKGLPEHSRPLHTHLPADYTLDDASTENQALLRTTDGAEAGLQHDMLSPPPLTEPVQPLPAPPAGNEPPPEEEQS